jgi:hypothetical protein
VNADKRALIVCPSLGKNCGIAEYSRHTMMVLAAAGWSVKGVRTIREVAEDVGNGQPVDVIIVQHEYGLWQRDRRPNGLSEGESTADLVAALPQIQAFGPNVRLAIVCHTVLAGSHDDTALLIGSGVPLFALHRGGAAILGGKFLELGVPPVEGFAPSAPPSLEQPLVIGAFGMFVPTKGLRSVVDLCRRLKATLTICSYCRTDEDRRALESLVEGIDARVYDKFLSDKEVLERLAACHVLYLPQGEKQPSGIRPRAFSASASVRMMLNLRRPVIVNRFWGYEELLDVLPVADSVDEAESRVRQMCREPEIYRSWIEKIDQFVGANQLGDKALAMVAKLQSVPLPVISNPVVSDEQRVTPENVARLTDDFIRHIPDYPGAFSGRGIVICAGGLKYSPSAWVLIRMLRHLGCSLPIEVWYRGDEERDESWMELVKPHGVECVDASEIRLQYPHSSLGGWELKPYAVLHSRFREVMLLDADNVPVRDPTYLFETPEYRDHGAMFWPDSGRMSANDPAWQAFGVEYRDERSFESGQMLIDKARCWRTLNLCNWYNEQSHYYYRIVYGDKDTFRFAWHRLGQQFAMPQREMGNLAFTLLQYDPTGNLIFQHRCADKWSLTGNRRSAGFQREQTCLEFNGELAARWNPVACQLQHLSNRDRAQMARIAEKAYQYVLVGRRRWPIRLSADGRVIGAGPLERYWWFRDGQLLFSRLDGREPTALSALSDGSWRGRTTHYGGVDIRLVRTRREVGSAFANESAPARGALEIHRSLDSAN